MSYDKYRVTKEQCEANISGVCEGCGRELSAIETVDNSGNPTFWQGCQKCSCFRRGVEPKYFKIARKLIEENTLRPFSHMDITEYNDNPDKLEYYYDCQTSGLSPIIRHIDKLLKEIS